MKLINIKTTSNGTRNLTKIEKNNLVKNNKILKSLRYWKKNCFGRSNSTGNITVWHKGGGVKKFYRKINFSNNVKNGLVLAVCYDPYRTGFINLNFDLKKKIFYFETTTNNIYPGFLIKNSIKINELKLGYRTNIQSIPTGSIIHNLSLNKQQKSQYIKSAGTFGQIIQKDFKKAKIKLPSKKILKISTQAFATIGLVSNTKNNKIRLGKAGKKRLKGIRPTVRGIAMNPVDHPHGGRTNGGRPSVSPWGILTKGGFKLRKK